MAKKKEGWMIVAVEPFVPGDDWDGPYQGVDWGFAASPTALVRMWIYGTELFIEYEAYGVGVEGMHGNAPWQRKKKAG